MNRLSTCLTASLLVPLIAFPALAGTAPVEPPPSPPVVVGGTIDTSSVAAALAVIAPSSPAVTSALASLSEATPGSIQALTAIDNLAGAISLALSTGEFGLPSLSGAQLSQAIGLVDGLIASVGSNGLGTAGLQALRAALAAPAAGLGVGP